MSLIANNILNADNNEQKIIHYFLTIASFKQIHVKSGHLLTEIKHKKRKLIGILVPAKSSLMFLLLLAIS